MSDKFLPNISVGDFAMDILKSMAKDPNGLKPALKESTIQSAGAPDVSRIQVSEDFVSLVTEGKKPVKKSTAHPIKETTENKLTSLVERLSSLITEARSIMEEISSGATTTGNLGVNMASKSKPKTKKAISKFLLKYKNG
jgi:hypothetical protein